LDIAAFDDFSPLLGELELLTASDLESLVVTPLELDDLTNLIDLGELPV
jgi:hypothetical protein